MLPAVCSLWSSEMPVLLWEECTSISLTKQLLYTETPNIQVQTNTYRNVQNKCKHAWKRNRIFRNKSQTHHIVPYMYLVSTKVRRLLRGAPTQVMQ